MQETAWLPLLPLLGIHENWEKISSLVKYSYTWSVGHQTQVSPTHPSARQLVHSPMWHPCIDYVVQAKWTRLVCAWAADPLLFFFFFASNGREKHIHCQFTQQRA